MRNIINKDEVYHHGVKGMKWGRRKARPDSDGSGFSRGFGRLKDGVSKGLSKTKVSIKKHSSGELSQRGKAALDVLMNGDTDWMGNSTCSDDAVKELSNRGKAALERLIYSQDQIDNKKFFGRYNF